MNGSYLSIDKINLKNIKYGKKQNYGSNDYVPIYHQTNNKQKHLPLVIKTPKLFIKNTIHTYNNKQYFLTVFLSNKHEQNNIDLFINFIESLEKKILSSRKYNTGLKKNFISLINEYNGYKKITLPININTSECYDVDNKRINKWNFKTPTYGYFIISFKNIWLSNKSLGINLFTHGALILPSQYCDPEPIKDIQYLFSDDIHNFKESLREKERNENVISKHQEYQQFFKMKSVGVPVQAIKHKIKLAGLNENIIDYHTNTPISKIKELRLPPPNIPYPPPLPLPPHCQGKFTPLHGPGPGPGPNLSKILAGGALKNGLSNLKKIDRRKISKKPSGKKYRFGENEPPSLEEIIKGRNNLKRVEKI